MWYYRSDSSHIRNEERGFGSIEIYYRVVRRVIPPLSPLGINGLFAHGTSVPPLSPRRRVGTPVSMGKGRRLSYKR